MEKLRRRSEITFALIWIAIYVVGASVGDETSRNIGVEKSLTLPILASMAGVLLVFLKKNNLLEYYGLCAPKVPAKHFLYYIPLVILVSVQLWFGVHPNGPVIWVAFYIGAMLCVGLLEELIFRGFLFQAMRKDNLTAAIIVSSVTFGLGHVVNLINGSGMGLVPNLCQILYATAIGYLFVIIFYKSGSLWACILAHGIFNSLNAFYNEAVGEEYLIPVAVGIAIFVTAYAVWIQKTVPDQTIV